MSEIFYLDLTAHEKEELRQLGRQLFYEGRTTVKDLARFDELQAREDNYQSKLNTMKPWEK